MKILEIKSIQKSKEKEIIFKQCFEILKICSFTTVLVLMRQSFQWTLMLVCSFCFFFCHSNCPVFFLHSTGRVLSGQLASLCFGVQQSRILDCRKCPDLRILIKSQRWRIEARYEQPHLSFRKCSNQKELVCGLGHSSRLFQYRNNK